MSHDELLHEASLIADRYVADAVHARDECTWVQRVLPEMPTANSRRPTSRAAGAKLFDGAAGIGLFLARAYGRTHDAAHARAARGAIRHALRLASGQLVPGPENPEFSNRFGFYSGALGVAWAAVETADLLGAPDLRERAELILRRLARTRTAPRVDDLIFGAPGAIPALIDLEAKGVTGSLALARALGDDLLGSARRDGEIWSWEPPRKDWHGFLTGFSHGASGHAFGLARLYEATQVVAYREAAEGALAYERLHHIASLGNWPDFRVSVPGTDGQRVTANWCHGAPGIGLARVLVHPAIRDARLLDEARIARATTEADILARLEKPGANWMLCHGLAGNIETLHLIEERLGVPDALARARRFTAQGLALYGDGARRKWGTSFLDWPTGIAGVEERSLMKGLAGIGLHLLRLHSPREVPSILVPGLSARPVVTTLAPEAIA